MIRENTFKSGVNVRNTYERIYVVSNACTIAISFVKSYFSINCNKHCEHLLTTVCAAVIPVVFSICVAPHLCIATAVTRPAGLTVNS